MQNMRGRLYPSAGIAGLATLPAARRKGYLRQVMAVLAKLLRGRSFLFGPVPFPQIVL
jgi:predicted acetyltransferase